MKTKSPQNKVTKTISIAFVLMLISLFYFCGAINILGLIGVDNALYTFICIIMSVKLAHITIKLIQKQKRKKETPLLQPNQAVYSYPYVSQTIKLSPGVNGATPLGTDPSDRSAQTDTGSSSLTEAASHLSPDAFEIWIAQLLVRIGWQDVVRVGGSRDRGVDIRGKYQGQKCIVQCKHYPGKLVPPNDVRALVGTWNIQHGVKRAYLITSGRFSHQCFKEVNKKPVELWDLDTLEVHLQNANQ